MSGRSAGYSHLDRTLNAKVLIRPGTTDEVSRILKICDEQKQPVVCHGGLTGLVDGSIAGENDVILSLERMRKIEDINTNSATMAVQAGVTLQTVQETTEEAGPDNTLPDPYRVTHFFQFIQQQLLLHLTMYPHRIRASLSFHRRYH